MSRPQKPRSFHSTASRRQILQAGLGAAFGLALPWSERHRTARAAAAPAHGLIESIESLVIFPGRTQGTTWFHPRGCAAPAGDGSFVLMTVQSISGSDNFGAVYWTICRDDGATWSAPQAVESFGRHPLPDPGWEEGVCDVVPEYHPQTKTILAMGHNVFYHNNKLAVPQRPRWPVYAVRTAEGQWSPRKRLQWDDPRGAFIYTCGCAQRLTLANGDILVPLSFGATAKEPRSVTTVRCKFDGRELAVQEVGTILSHPVKRGLLEPSVASLGGRYYMTIRAEDERGYVAVSDDGLHWQPQQPWCWDDDAPLTMSTTQQRWLPHSHGLFLVYTRRTDENTNVMRWRAPLFTAAVDPHTLRLIRASERVVFPMIGDGIHAGQDVARMGNFHTVAAKPAESWITVGETLPRNAWKGNTLLARVRWTQSNANFGAGW